MHILTIHLLEIALELIDDVIVDLTLALADSTPNRYFRLLSAAAKYLSYLLYLQAASVDVEAIRTAIGFIIDNFDEEETITDPVVLARILYVANSVSSLAPVNPYSGIPLPPEETQLTYSPVKEIAVRLATSDLWSIKSAHSNYYIAFLLQAVEDGNRHALAVLAALALVNTQETSNEFEVATGLQWTGDFEGSGNCAAFVSIVLASAGLPFASYDNYIPDNTQEYLNDWSFYHWSILPSQNNVWANTVNNGPTPTGYVFVGTTCIRGVAGLLSAFQHQNDPNDPDDYNGSLINSVTQISEEDVQIGDLVISNNINNSDGDHVAIVVGFGAKQTGIAQQPPQLFLTYDDAESNGITEEDIIPYTVDHGHGTLFLHGERYYPIPISDSRTPENGRSFEYSYFRISYPTSS